MTFESSPIVTNTEVSEGLSEIETSTLGKEFDEKETIPEKDIDSVLEGIAKISGLQTDNDLKKEIPLPKSEKVTLGKQILSNYGFEMSSYIIDRRGLQENVTIEDNTNTEFPIYFLTGLMEKVSKILQKNDGHKEIAKILNPKNIEKIIISESEQDNYSFLTFEVSVIEKNWFHTKKHIINFNLDLLGKITILN